MAGREGWNEQLLEQFAERCPGVAFAERCPGAASAERRPWVASAERHLGAAAAELMTDVHQLWATAFLRIHKSVCLLLHLLAFHCTENQIYVFPKTELRGLSPNSYIHVSVSDLYIPRIGPHIWLKLNRQIDPGNI